MSARNALVTVGGSSIRVLSEATGHVLSSSPLVPSLPQSPTGPVAVNANGRTAYVAVLTGPACWSSEIVAIDVGSGRDRVVATAASAPAISPDGAYLAWVSSLTSCSPGQVTIEDLASGHRRSWRIGSPTAPGDQVLTGLAWAPGGRRLVIASVSGPASGLEVLDTTRPAGPDNPAAVGPVSYHGDLPSGRYTYPVVRPDGTLVAILPYCVPPTSCGGGTPPGEGDRVVTVRQVTGQIGSTILPATADPGAQLSGLVAGASGQLALVGRTSAGSSLYSIAGGRLHLIARDVVSAGWLPIAATRKVDHASPPPSQASSDGTLRGTLLIAGGPAPGISRPVPGTVQASGKGRRIAVTVGGNGRFSMNLPPGTYEVTGHSPNVAEGFATCVAGHPEKVRPRKITTVVVACGAR